MKTNTKIKLLSSATTAIVLLTSASAFAQTATTKPADATTTTNAKTADEDQTAIVVTGSLIRNPNLVQANPVNVTTADQIELTDRYAALIACAASNVRRLGDRSWARRMWRLKGWRRQRRREFEQVQPTEMRTGNAARPRAASTGAGYTAASRLAGI